MVESSVKFYVLCTTVSTQVKQGFLVLRRFSVVRSYCGHGIGELFHCAPNIPHYAHNKVSTSCSIQCTLLSRDCCFIGMQNVLGCKLSAQEVFPVL